MHLITFSLLALGLFARAGAYFLPDKSSARDLDASANVDLALDTDIIFGDGESDVFDEYNRRDYGARSFDLLQDQAETIDNVINIVGQLNISMVPHIEAIQSQISQLQSDGQGDPQAIIAPNLRSIVSVTQQATTQLKEVPPTSDIDDESSDDSPSLSSVLDLTKSILDVVSSVIGLAGSIAKLGGDTSSITPLGTSLSNFTTSVGTTVPGIQSFVSDDPASPNLATRAESLGFTQLAEFLTHES